MEMFTRLLEINLTKDGVSLNPTIVSWTGGDAVNALPLCDHLTNSIYDNFIFVGDFNGDGFSDIATVPFKPKNGYADSVVLKVHLNLVFQTDIILMKIRHVQLNCQKDLTGWMLLT